jgi:L-ascorbate metabolism protein UlaG (beta-lactamase superfamily)
MLSNDDKISNITTVLKEEINNKEAIIWYLHHSGWAIKTKDYFLIFDYHKRLGESLAKGYINPNEVKNQNILVFITHVHGDHFSERILELEKTVKNIQYIFGWEYKNGMKYKNINPKETLTLNDIEITTIKSKDLGVGFIVKLNKLVLFHAGDHLNGKWFPKTFSSEIDSLANKKLNIDIAFIPVVDGGCLVSEETTVGAFYYIDKLNPKIMFPMHGEGCEYYYVDFLKASIKKKFKTKICIARNNGDCFFYSNEKIKPITN